MIKLKDKATKAIEAYDWEGVGTMGDILDLCPLCKTPEHAELLLEKYGDVCEFARENLGYMFGYYDPATRERMYALFPVNHPVFGKKFGRGVYPSPSKAFEMGKSVVRQNE